MRAGGVRAQRAALLAWYAPRRSAYPWRRTRDPYAVLVSEVMLQQTQASRVVPAFERFVSVFPTADVLASFPRSAAVEAWDGLGYNRRAVSLWRAARVVVAEHGGSLPSDPAALRSLPGVGPYTAAAVASIAFGAPVAAIDTNVRRVVGRVLAGGDDIGTPDVGRLATAWLDRARPGDWNQAVMDLGRGFCRPRPRCDDCPLSSMCRFARSGAVARPSARRKQEAFAGSMRQVRGDVVRTLRSRPSTSLGRLATLTGHPVDRLESAVAGLVSDGIVEAGAGALVGSSRGRVRLAR
jgi:A/G-specific adenine glycosylase